MTPSDNQSLAEGEGASPVGHTEVRLEAARDLVRAALIAADNGNHAGEQAVLAMAQWADMLGALTEIDGLEVMELNPSNYDHEIVCELNRNAVQASLIARAAIISATVSK